MYAVGGQPEGVQFSCKFRRLISYCQDWLQAPFFNILNRIINIVSCFKIISLAVLCKK